MAFLGESYVLLVILFNTFNTGDAASNCSNLVCQNGGTCTWQDFWYTCSCPTRYYGSSCQYDNCNCGLYGTCQDDSTNTEGYSCICNPGFIGDACNFDTRPCAAIPCKNLATCTNDPSLTSYTCDCRVGYYGVNCEYYSRRCDSQPCQNGGTCTELESIHNYVCNCDSSHYGYNCESAFYTISNIPAIAGGIIGGIFVLVLIVLGIVFIIRYSERQRRPVVTNGTPAWTLTEPTTQTGVPTVMMTSGQTTSAPYPPNAVPGPYIGYPGQTNYGYSNFAGGPTAYTVLPPPLTLANPPAFASQTSPVTYPPLPNVNETKSAIPN